MNTLAMVRPHAGADPLQAHTILRVRPVTVLTVSLDAAAPAKLCSANKERVALGIINLSGATIFISDETPVKTTRRISIPNGTTFVLDRPTGPQNAIYVAGIAAGLVESWELIRIWGDDYFQGQE